MGVCADSRSGAVTDAPGASYAVPSCSRHESGSSRRYGDSERTVPSRLRWPTRIPVVSTVLREGVVLSRRWSSKSELALDLMSPLVAFPFVWLLGVALAQIHILDIQQPWSRLAWVVMLVVPLAFVTGGLLASQVVAAWSIGGERRVVTAVGRHRLRIALVICLVLGYLEEAHQWFVAGGVPLLSSNIDATRFSQPGGPTIVLTDLLVVAAIVALVVPNNLFEREALFELAVATAALAAFALAGGRSTVVMPLAVAVLVRTIYWGLPRIWVIVGGGSLPRPEHRRCSTFECLSIVATPSEQSSTATSSRAHRESSIR